VICLVWFQTKEPANQNHGFLKPNQIILMVSGWFWFWFEAGETKTMVTNHGFDAVFLFVIFRRQQAHFGLQIVWVATPSIIKAHNLCLLLVVLQESPGEKVSATGNSRNMMAEFDLVVADLFLRCS
jgi:hypothetical protein